MGGGGGGRHAPQPLNFCDLNIRSYIYYGLLDGKNVTPSPKSKHLPMPVLTLVPNWRSTPMVPIYIIILDPDERRPTTVRSNDTLVDTPFQLISGFFHVNQGVLCC